MSADQPPPDQAPQGGAAGAHAASSALPADVLADVEREQALADVQASLSASEGVVDQLKKEKDAIASERDAAVSTADQLRSQLALLQSAHHQSAAQLSVSQSRIDAAEREKRELVEERERLQQRANRSTQEMYTLRSQKSEASQKNAQYEVEVSELKMAGDSAKFREQRALQALENSRLEITNLTKASGDLETRFSQYRVKSQADFSEIQLENERLQARVTSVESAHQALQRSYGDQSRRLADAVANVASLTTAADSKRNEFRLEFERLMEENRLLKKHSDEARQAVAQREADLESVESDLAESEQRWTARLQREERARQEAEKRADDHKVVLQRLASDTSISPTANILSQIGQDGKTFTQFYADHALLQEELGKKEQEISRLESTLEHILADIKEKQGYMNEREEDYEVATERANSLAAELSTTQQQRDALQEANKSLESAAQKYVEDIRSSQAACEDLSRQVQSLLREIEVRDDPSLASVAFNNAAKVSEGDIISDKLVQFQSLRALQQQNLNLLRVTRKLQAKLEAIEVGRATAEENDGMSDLMSMAHTKLEQAHGRINEIQAKLIDVTRERDTFSRLLSRGDGLRWPNGSSTGGPTADGHDHSNENAISSLETELEILRNKAEADVAEAKQDARKQSEAASSADIARAKAEAKASVLEEQVRIANETDSLQKGQISSLESQINQFQLQLVQTQQERRKALEDVVTHQGAETKLRNEASQLRAEKEQWESYQARLQSDFSSVQQERARLQHTIDNLSSVQGENDRTRGEDQTKLERRIDELQRETTTLRSQVDQAREAKAVAEKKVAEADARIASETSTIRSEKEAAEAAVATKTTEIETLTAEITARKAEVERVKGMGLKWQQKFKELQGTTASANAGIAEKEAQITALRAEVEEKANKVSEVEKKLADAEQAGQLKDGTITKLQVELAKAGEAGEAAAVPAADPTDQAQLTALKTERDSLQERLTKAEQDLAAAKASATATPAAPASDSDLQTQLNETTTKLDDLNKKYEADVATVNRSNRGLMNRNKTLMGEKAGLDTEVAGLKKQIEELTAEIAGLKKQIEELKAGAGGEGVDTDAAIKAAVAKREEELRAEHVPDTAAITAAVSAREAELKKEHDAALAAASAASVSANPDKVTELEKKIKVLEKSVITAQIARKTLEKKEKALERQIEQLSGASKSADAPAAASPAPVAVASPTPVPAASPAAATPAPATPTPAPVATPAATVPEPTSDATAPAPDSASPATSSPAVRGAARGRGRGATRGRGTGRNILSAVNATLSEGGTKRAAPEEGETPPRANTAKRLRGGARGRGRGGSTGTGDQ